MALRAVCLRAAPLSRSGVQVVLQGSYGTLKTVASSLRHDSQAVLVRDSGGAALVIAEIVEPFLTRASALPLEGFVREKAIQDRIEAYKHEKRYEVLQMLRGSEKYREVRMGPSHTLIHPCLLFTLAVSSFSLSRCLLPSLPLHLPLSG